MKSIFELDEEALKYLSQQISTDWVIEYFKIHPKEFSKIKPGFRSQSLSSSEAKKILLESLLNKGGISKAVEKNVEKWINATKEALQKSQDDGLTIDESYILALAFSKFNANLPLYFEIVGEKKSEEYIDLLSGGVTQVSKFKNLLDGLKKDNERKEKNIKKLENELDEKKIIIAESKGKEDNYKTRLRELENEIHTKSETINNITAVLNQKESLGKELSQKIDFLNDKVKKGSQEIEEINNLLKSKKEEYQQNLDELTTSYNNELADCHMEIETLKNNLEQKNSERLQDALEKERLNRELEALKEQLTQLSLEMKGNDDYKGNEKSIGGRTLACLLKPESMEEFEEYFIYNLNDLGIDESKPYFNCFLQYLMGTAFEGMPLLMKFASGVNIAKCLSNTICGHDSITIIEYFDFRDINELVDVLINSNSRILVLDGFVGNCNLIDLMSMLNNSRDKIIILTYVFDRTINYIPPEFLSYVTYINTDEIEPLRKIKTLTEDSSTVKEIAYITDETESENNRYKKIFYEIGEQCDVDKCILHTMSRYISDEDSLNGVLIFSLLPYLSNVMKIKPFEKSARLRKFAGPIGRCSMRTIIGEWFE